MQQNIKYTGLATTPSDYECPDGQLAVALGLVGDDGSLKAIPHPQVVGVSLGDRRVLFLHATTLYRHYIVVNADATHLYWIDEEYLRGDHTPQQAQQHLVEITHTIGTVITVNAMGNTLAVMTDGGLHYILWKNTAYHPLGQKPPELQMQFSTTQQYAVIDTETRYADYCKYTTEIWGLIARLNKMVTDANRFYAPFKIRYCYRLFDGSMFMHSAPVFMPITAPYTYQVERLRFYVKNDSIKTLPDNVYMEERTGGDNWQSINITLRYRYEPNNVGLLYRVLTDISAQLEEWADIVKSVDVFVTPPILREIPDSTLSAFAYKIEQPICHYRHGMTRKYGNLRVPDSEGPYDHSKCVVLDIPLYPEDEYLAKIKEASTFYKIASFDLSQDELKYSTSWEPVPIGTGILGTLAQQEVMVDDYRTHNNLVPTYNGQAVSRTSLFSYNNRLNISGVNDRLFQGFRVATMVPYDSREDQTTPTNCVRIIFSYIVLQTNDGRKTVQRYVPGTYPDLVWKTFLKDIPLFYPDRRAKEMYIGVIDNGEKCYKFIMEEAPMLNGAYTKGGIIIDTGSVPSFDEEWPEGPIPPVIDDIENTVNKVYTSEVENPYYFPALNTNSVGTGVIMALCTTTKALSQGQFGQFPLYAFASDGVWTLSVAADGTYSSIHAVSRDVCTNPNSITQMDNAILFVTDRGIMLLQGSDTVCITDGILGDKPFDPSTLPHLSSLHPCNAEAMTHAFLADCRMIYDYRHQHIIVFNPAVGDNTPHLYPHAFVYNIKSRLWGMMDSNLAATVNNYPEATAIDHDGHLVSFTAEDDGTPVEGLLVTRPLKLGNADGLKTIHTLLQRGVFQRGDVKTILYGSRDLIHWHLVASSVDNTLRGLRGTPYKYFRIAALVTLDPGESLSGATVDFEPRHTTKLH